MRADKTQQRLKEKLQATIEMQGVPAPLAAEIAEEKTKHTARGVLYMVLGVLVLLVSLALLLLPFIVLKEAPGIVLAGSSGLGVVVAVYLIFSGGNLASGEAMDAAKEMEGLFGWLAKGVGLVRPKK